MMRISASIVTYNTRREDLERVIRSALSDSISRLYVVDHSPGEGIEAMLPADGRITYIRRPNLGYGAGHNFAIRKAMEEDARYHAVLNPDIFWEGNLVERLADYMDGNPKAGLTVPRVRYPDGRLQYVCKLIPTPLDLVANRFLPSWMFRKRLERFRLEQTGYREVMNVPYMHGCFFMLRMDALRDVGLFDERFFMYPEDIDLTRRLHERWQTLYYPSLTLYHAHAAESRKSLRMLRIHAVNMVRYFNKWGWFFDPSRRRINRAVRARLLSAEVGRDLAP